MPPEEYCEVTMRIELIHPMLIHFPLALLFTGSGLRAGSFFVRRSSFYPSLLSTSRLILAIGVCFAWASVAAGEVASDVVERTLCKPQVLQTHSTLAYFASTLFTAGLLLDLGRGSKKLRSYQQAAMALNLFFYFAGALVLLLTGFFGGDLVYSQGAAVCDQCSKPML